MKMELMIFFSILTLSLSAPEAESLMIEASEPVNLFETYFKAVCKIESNNNPYDIHFYEGSIGIAQLRQCNLVDYNAKHVPKIHLFACLSPEVSKKIFLWLCSFYN